MDKHCVSLEIAKQLKESGFKKETEFCWEHYNKAVIGKKRILQGELNWKLTKGMVCKWDGRLAHYPAPLATEILEELPREVSIKQYPENDSVRYQVGHNAGRMALQTFRYSNNLCDALAEMWLYLRKEN